MQVAQERIKVTCEDVQGKELHRLCEQPITLLCHPHNKKWFLVFKENLLHFHLCSLPLFLSLGNTGRSLTPSLLHSPKDFFCSVSGFFSVKVGHGQWRMNKEIFRKWNVLIFYMNYKYVKKIRSLKKESQ